MPSGLVVKLRKGKRQGTAPPSAGAKRRPNPALGKAVAIIEAVTRRGITSIPDIAAALNIPRQTVFRSVRQLVQAGLLKREALRERYTAGPRLVELARGTLLHSHRHGPAHSVLEYVVAETGETCNLGMLEGNSVIYIDRVESKWPLRMRFEQGTHVPAHSTAIGKVLVANLPARARRRLIGAAPLTRFTDRTLIDPDALEHEFETIREQGFAINDQESALGIMGIAVPVLDSRKRVFAGLALSAPAARLSRAAALKLIPLLKDAAKRLSELEASTNKGPAD